MKQDVLLLIVCLMCLMYSAILSLASASEVLKCRSTEAGLFLRYEQSENLLLDCIFW